MLGGAAGMQGGLGNALGAAVGGAVIASGLGYGLVPVAGGIFAGPAQGRGPFFRPAGNKRA